jgi:hypothetical protein|nr:MAG TPA: hypothetical protein [Caudoviricetes sp.]
MAYDTTKLVKLAALKALAEKVNSDYTKKTDFDALNEQVQGLVTAGGEPNVLTSVKVNGVALAIAEKAVDILIATGTANGTLAVNGADIAVKGLAALAYKAQVSESDLDSALTAVLAAKAAKADVDTLIGSDTGKSVRTIANEELAAQLIPESAQESLDTLAEIAAWIQEHPDDAATMNAAITKLNGIVAGIGGEEDDYATVIAAIEGKISAAQSAIYAAITAGNTNGHLKVNGTDVTIYTHPAHTAKASGLYKVTVDGEGHVSAAEAVAKADITALGIPAQDTTYTDVTAGGASGLMSGADKTKLDGLIVAEDTEVTEMLNEVFAASTEPEVQG